jgi:predicted small lipoprotein YifL
MRPMRSMLLAASVAALVAGCGGDDAPASLPDAKAALSKDCQNGKSSDKPLCDCIADRLADAGNDAAALN